MVGLLFTNAFLPSLLWDSIICIDPAGLFNAGFTIANSGSGVGSRGGRNAVVIVQPLTLFGTPWTAAHEAPLSFTVSWGLLKFMSIESVMLPNRLLLSCPLLLLPPIFSSTRVFSNESTWAWAGKMHPCLWSLPGLVRRDHRGSLCSCFIPKRSLSSAFERFMANKFHSSLPLWNTLGVSSSLAINRKKRVGRGGVNFLVTWNAKQMLLDKH